MRTCHPLLAMLALLASACSDYSGRPGATEPPSPSDTAATTAGTTADHSSPDAPPVAQFTYSCAGLTCTLDGRSSTDDRGITSYSWDLGKLPDRTASGSVVIATYAHVGPRTVILMVTDGAGQTSSVTKIIQVGGSSPPPSDAPPVAQFTYSCAGLTCTLDGRGSSDDKGVVSYNWDLGKLPDRFAAGAVVSATYPHEGPRTVVLTVTDGGGQANSTTKTIQVGGTSTQPPPPPPPAPGAIFSDGFESGTLSLWQDGVDPARHRVLTDPALARSGSRLLEITYPAGSSGGWLTRFFMPGYDSVYVRYYVRFASDWEGGTKLLLLRGSRVDNPWSAFGVAGQCPTGSEWFATNVVTESGGNPGAIRFYSYFPAMSREPDGVTCWGRFSGQGATAYREPLAMTRGEWHEVEFWVRLNTPGRADAVQRVWVDGVLKGEWTGLSFRTTTNLRLNSLTLEASTMGPPAPKTQRLYIDDVAVFTTSLR